MRIRLEIGAIFIAVGLGALTATVLDDPMALIPHPPYRDWIVARLFARFLHLPTNRPWAYEMQVVDPDGHVLRFGSEPREDSNAPDAG